MIFAASLRCFHSSSTKPRRLFGSRHCCKTLATSFYCSWLEYAVETRKEMPPPLALLFFNFPSYPVTCPSVILIHHSFFSFCDQELHASYFDFQVFVFLVQSKSERFQGKFLQDSSSRIPGFEKKFFEAFLLFLYRGFL